MIAVDLFSGCGGFSLGFERAGISVAAAYENWQPAIETYRKNFAHPIHDMDLSDAESAAGHIANNYHPEIIIGGPPCQDFSIANNKKSTKRANLTIRFAEIISTVRPKFFVMENVYNIEKSSFLSIALRIFSESGYGITSRIIEACRVGVPQMRRRYFLIGGLGLEPGAFAHDLDSGLSEHRTTVRDYLGEALALDHYYAHPRSYQRRAIFSVDEPAATIRRVNRPVPPNYRLHKGDKAPVTNSLRALTTSERARLQTFPEGFQFSGTASQKEQQIGNAVPVLMAEYVAKSILRTLDSSDSVSARHAKDVADRELHEIHME